MVTASDAQPTTAGGQIITNASTLGTLFGIHDGLDHVKTTRQNLASGNTAAGGSSGLTIVHKALKNDSITLSRLCQEVKATAHEYT